jgi:hypothetical protein
MRTPDPIPVPTTTTTSYLQLSAATNMIPACARPYLLYIAASLSALAVFKHTSISIRDIFPVLDRALRPADLIAFSAKSNFL